MKKTTKVFLISLLAFVMAMPLWSLSAKVTYVKGKVEVSRNGTWRPLKVGDSIELNETISTGYQSEARLNLNGSVLAVAALSRVKVESLSSGSSKDTVSVYIDTGATRSKVNRTENKKIDYTTRTAVAVASVRGTVYTQTAAGDLWCDEGVVFTYPANQYIPSSEQEDTVVSTTSKEDTTTTEAQKSEESTTKKSTDSLKNIIYSEVVTKGQTTSFTRRGVPTKTETVQKNLSTSLRNSVLTKAQSEFVSNNQIEEQIFGNTVDLGSGTGVLIIICSLPEGI